MIDIGSIQAAGASLLTAADIARSLLKLKVSGEVQTKVIELQREIMAAQSSAMTAQTDQFALLERIRELEQKIAGFEAWKTEKQRYKLAKCGNGMVAYVLKRSESHGEPGHSLCANCYQRGEKAILQSNGHPQTIHHVYVCPICKSAIAASSQTMPEYAD